MKFDEIMEKLSKDEPAVIAGGEVIINRKLQCLIGGIPVYDIIIMYPKEHKEPTVLKSLDELYDLSLMYASKADIRRCIMCGDLPENGYYFDYEVEQYYCSYNCLVQWMNKVHGIGCWRIDYSDFGKQRFLVRITEEEVKDCSDAIKIDGIWWRYYNIEYILPYDFIETFELGSKDEESFEEPDED